MALEADAGQLRRSHKLARRPIAAVVLIAAVALGAFFLIKGLTGGGGSESGTLKGSSKNGFTLSYPSAWRPLSKDELAKLPGNPLAVVQRKDGKGFIVVRREKRAPASFGAFSTQLTSELEKRVPDFQKRSAKTVKISGGQAFLYSYVRKRRGTVHAVVIVPDGKRSYAINSVSRGGADNVAREVARIILSFKA
jgi:PsbP-like protein